ncbi:MAG: hypothetical protein AAF791_10680 [Bacteroidota bacterium]
MTARLLLFLLATLALVGCSGGGEATSPDGDETFGHRYGSLAPDGRETVFLSPPDSVRRVLVYPAVLDSVSVRLERPATLRTKPVRVEVLLKGVLPDACSRLQNAEQIRRGHLINVDLTIRQPRGRACAQVVRPFRFYLPLDGTFEPGSYTLKVNGAALPFRIRELEPDE